MDSFESNDPVEEGTENPENPPTDIVEPTTTDIKPSVDHSPSPPVQQPTPQSIEETKEQNLVTGKPPAAFVPSGPRRSSSRSIKRPKFDDELVDTSALKRTSSSSRRTSESSPIEQKSKRSVVKPQSQTSSTTNSKKKDKKLKPTPVPTDFGRWRPTDDLSLISAVTQTCDLQTVHLAVRFSCNFTLKEIQDRWYALLYDPFVSRLAQQAMKALPSDVVEEIMNNALWSRNEDCLVGDMNIDDKPELSDFQKLLNDNLEIFHKSRTAKTIHDHWSLLRTYQLLSCQQAKNVSGTSTVLADMEGKIVDDQIVRGEDDALNQELAVSDRSQKREIRRLEQEIPNWEMLIEKSEHVEGLKLSEFDDDVLAILKGRIMKYKITKNQVVIGRNCNDFEVDIDLSMEGPSLKISRRQGLILHEDGVFYLENIGKRPFYINGFPLATGQSARLVNDSVIEIHCIKLLFLINTKMESSEDQNNETDATGSKVKVEE